MAQIVQHNLFCYSASVVGTIRFPYAHQLAENKGRCGDTVVSCSGSCGKTRLHRQLCSCDDSCLYIGDCCFDFVYLCKGGNDLDDALTHQEQMLDYFTRKTLCSELYFQDERVAGDIVYKIISIPMVVKCPSNATKRLLNLCQHYEQHVFPALPQIPVMHRGIIYRNIYCLLCNGANPGDVRLLSHTLVNSTDVREEKKYSTQIYSSVLITGIEEYRLSRLSQVCNSKCKFHNNNCSDEQIARECRAYQAPGIAVLSDGSKRVLKNLACLKCGNTTIKEYKCELRACYNVGLSGRMRKWISLFDFVGKTHHISTQKGAPNCDSIRCQYGYRLRETSCTYCMKENISSPSISVTWYQASVLLIFRSRDAADAFRQMYRRRFVNTDQNCVSATYWLQDIGLVNFSARNMVNKTECLLLPISYLEVQFYVNIFQSDIFMEQVIPGLPNMLRSAYIFNFDVKYKADCVQGIVMTTLLEDMQGDVSTPDYMPPNESYRQPPWVFTRSFVISKERGRIWKLLCTDECDDNFNCSHVDTSDLNACTKAEIQFTSKSEYGFWTKSGHFVKHHSKYLMTSNQTALICANKCKAVLFSDTQMLDILVPMCYSLSMACLMVTFIIYLIAPPLRNIPGLMLMNLIIALFLAQLSYLVSSYGVFLKYPHLCQFLGATQHYLWLTAFAWMACITIDIYQCLSTIHVSHPDSHKKRYYKLVVSSWLAPLIIPVVTLCLQFSGTVAVGYGGQNTCWFMNSNSVLYFFAIPVLSVVIINVLLFLGSIYRIRQISNNACYVGRKEDVKLRLVQCLKISSWIGTSWLFGVIPNIINIPELWYMFTICNAFQGVQIFLAFGLSKRSRKLLCGKITEDKNESTLPTSAHTEF